jgi:phosphoribosylformylglycinamidine cyclo-ligase
VSERVAGGPKAGDSAYAGAGVDIGAGQRATELMRAAVESTYRPEVLAGIGAFGGLYDAAGLLDLTAPVLVASTDGVGTKTKVAARLGRWDTIGQDLVNHCINDILVQGARPLFFLDYIASSRLDPDVVAAIVAGMAFACRGAGCALLGGETAEMPGVYEAGEVDVAGTLVGVVERASILDGAGIRPGDAILGLASTGLHTNGYSLARRALAGLDWSAEHPDLAGTPGDALLAVHRSYLEPVARWLAAGIALRGLAHITGGGLIDNPPRIFPAGVGAVLRRGTWPEPPIFDLIQRLSGAADDEMAHVFNLGLGMLAVVAPADVPAAQRALDEEVFVVGEIVPGRGVEIQR